MEKRRNNLLLVIILSVILGFFAGAVGEIVVKSYILPSFSVPYFNNEYSLSDLNYNRSNLIIRDAKKVVVSQDVKVEETINSIKPSLVAIFKKEDVNESLDSEQNLIYYNLNKPDFVGLAVTSDGWVASFLPLSEELEFDISEYVAITSEREVYELDDITTFDNLTGNLSFVHLKDISNLPVKEIVKHEDITLGKSVLVVKDFNNSFLTTISSLNEKSDINNSDELELNISLSDTLGDKYQNSFVFSMAGNILAVTLSSNSIIPAFSYSPYWQSFFEDGVVNKSYLGVNYLDLTHTKVLGVEKDKGALIMGSTSTPAILSGSPAELAGLKEGDIITWIDNKQIDRYNDLANVLTGYNPGEDISLVYLRDGEEYIVEIELGIKK